MVNVKYNNIAVLSHHFFIVTLTWNHPSSIASHPLFISHILFAFGSQIFHPKTLRIQLNFHNFRVMFAERVWTLVQMKNLFQVFLLLFFK